YGILIPGMTAIATGASSYDVGGTSGNAKARLAIHGGHDQDQMTQMNGMAITGPHINSGTFSFLEIPDGDIEEVVLTTGQLPAEVENGGVLINLVPKTGGNSYHGTVFGSY